MMKKTGPLEHLRSLPQLFRNEASRLKSVYLDKKMGIHTQGEKLLAGWDPEGSRPYQPAPYGRLENMFRFLRPTEEDVFVDLGCGKGRAVFLASRHRFRKVIGVEIDKGLYETALQNAGTFRPRGRGAAIEFLHRDVTGFDPGEGTVFFLFNPFGATVLRKALSNIQASLVTRPRKVRIVYYLPCCRAVLEEQDWLRFAGEIENQDCPVWESRAPS